MRRSFFGRIRFGIFSHFQLIVYSTVCLGVLAANHMIWTDVGDSRQLIDGKEVVARDVERDNLRPSWTFLNYSNEHEPADLIPSVLYEPRNLCRDLRHIVHVVFDHPSGTKRKIIRDYMAQVNSSLISTVFITGLEPQTVTSDSIPPALDLYTESLLYDDIVITNFTEKYRHATWKIFSALGWYAECNNTQPLWFIINDSDAVFNWGPFLRYLKEVERVGLETKTPEGTTTVTDPWNEPVYAGHMVHNDPVIKDKTSKNYEDVPIDTYPDFVIGTSILMNYQSVVAAAEERRKGRWHTSAGDVGIGMVLHDRGVRAQMIPQCIRNPTQFAREKVCPKPSLSITDCGCDTWYSYHSGSEFHKAIDLMLECLNKYPVEA